MRMTADRDLRTLYEQWSECELCDLGKRRKYLDKNFVPGHGVKRGIMFIGDSPREEEERDGTPFAGLSDKILMGVIDKVGIAANCYFTNLVTCRSCLAEINDAGTPITYKENGELLIRYRDQPPNPVQISCCLPRLYEEIYIVDPLVIVALGAVAASTLAQRNVPILQEAGKETHIEIPGVGRNPALTPSGKWGRKQHGTLHYPTQQNTVRYLCVPTFHPTYVARSMADASENGPVTQFYKHIKEATKTFVRLGEMYEMNVPKMQEGEP